MIPVATRPRRCPAAVRLLELWVPIPPGAWMSVSCECCVLSGRGLCDGPITHAEESYRGWCVCDNENSSTRRPRPTMTVESWKTLVMHQIYIFMVDWGQNVPLSKCGPQLAYPSSPNDRLNNIEHSWKPSLSATLRMSGLNPALSSEKPATNRLRLDISEFWLQVHKLALFPPKLGVGNAADICLCLHRMFSKLTWR
jgi:hypothetical protein